jgi:hypothetical protein
VKKHTRENELNEETDATAILSDFDLSVPEKSLNEQELLEYLAEAISYMIEHKLDFLLSLLYRLDVDEQKINTALLPGNPEPANFALAQLVLERQKQRMATKIAYKKQNPTSWNWDVD